MRPCEECFARRATGAVQFSPEHPSTDEAGRQHVCASCQYHLVSHGGGKPVRMARVGGDAS